MHAQAAVKIPPFELDLLELEEQNNSGHGNRAWISARASELRAVAESAANPVLRADYLRRLGRIQGTPR